MTQDEALVIAANVLARQMALLASMQQQLVDPIFNAPKVADAITNTNQAIGKIRGVLKDLLP